MANAGTTIPTAPPPKIKGGPVRPSKMSRRRAFVLIGVHVAALLHILHWWSTGRSVTPVEPSEAHEALTFGVINAGFLLLAASLVATLFLGRWFCGWACHVVALQDLCAWMLGKLGIRPRPVRARLLMLVPFLAAIDIFLLPRVLRWMDGQPYPAVRTELMTEALWETFPGPWMAVLTLLVCGFVIVYLLGAKAFCTYGCPYGALYGVAERFAKGRIRVNDACEGCGHCTATCSSNVDVRSEVARFGMVVDAGCMKCMDCVSVCPKNALSFGFGGVPEKAKGKSLRPRRVWDFSWPEEVAMAVVFAATLFAFRGLYDAVPFLLAIGIGVITAFCAVLWARLALRRDVTFQGYAMKADGRFLGAGIAVLATTPSLFGFAIHSGAVQVERRQGESALAAANTLADSPEGRASAEYPVVMAHALEHLTRAADWGFRTSPGLHNKLGSLCLGLAAHDVERKAELEARAEEHLIRAIELDDSFVNTRVRLVELLIQQARYEEATAVLEAALVREPTHPIAGRRAYDLVSVAPEMPGPRLLVVDHLIATGDLDNAQNALAPLREHIPDHPLVLQRVQRLEEARAATTTP